MMARIHMLTDEEVPSVAVFGRSYAGKALEDGPGVRAVHNMSGLLQTDILYDQGHWTRFMEAAMGFRFTYVSDETRAALEQSPEVAEMGCWPAADSVKCIDGSIVIKLS